MMPRRPGGLLGAINASKESAAGALDEASTCFRRSRTGLLRAEDQQSFEV